MKVIGLDLSTKSGFAVCEINNGVVSIIKSGTFFRGKDEEGTMDNYPKSMMQVAEKAARQVVDLVLSENPDVVVIEETNLGRNRFSQKTLEWIHYCVLSGVIGKHKIEYISTSEWRKILDIKMSKEDKAHNKNIKETGARGKLSQKHLAIRFVNGYFGLELKPKNEDEADALCLVLAFSKK